MSRDYSPYEQGKRPPASGNIDFNNAPGNKKQPYGNVDKPQKIANAGDVIPLVFCDRTDDDIGGVWVEPSLIKAGVRDLKSSQAFPISQGFMEGNPKKARIFIGLEALSFLARGAAVQSDAQHRYVSAATYASAPNTCPFPDDGATGMLYCGINNYTYFDPILKAQVDQRSNQRQVYKVGDFYNYKEITRAIGDCDNTTFTTSGSGFKIFDNETGDDLTDAYETELGGSVADTEHNRRFNPDPPFEVLGGLTDGTIVEGLFALDNDGNTDRDYLVEWTQATQDFYDDVGVGPDGFTFQRLCSSVNLQRNTSFDADESGQLIGIQTQHYRSTRRDIAAYPSTDDFSSFADITLLQITSNAFQSFPNGGSVPEDLKQVYSFYSEGVRVKKYSTSGTPSGASNQFVDLALHLFGLIKREDEAIKELARPVKTNNLQDIGTFCATYDMFFNGVLDQQYNLIDFLTAISPFFLLTFISNGGRYEFQPILPLKANNSIENTAITPVATFDESDILAGSYKKTFTPAEQRRDIIINVTYRDMNPVYISSPVGAMVRFSTTDDDAAVVSYDMSDFCATKDHAVLFAKYELSKRKLSTHSIEFQTALDTNTLKVTDVVRVQRTRINSIGDDRTETENYQITAVSHSSDGTSTFVAMHFPLATDNTAKISTEVLTGNFKITSS